MLPYFDQASFLCPYKELQNAVSFISIGLKQSLDLVIFIFIYIHIQQSDTFPSPRLMCITRRQHRCGAPSPGSSGWRTEAGSGMTGSCFWPAQRKVPSNFSTTDKSSSLGYSKDMKGVFGVHFYMHVQL